LNGITIRLPPLRERREDIPLLVDHFLRVFNRSLNRSVREVAPEVAQLLVAHAWPGNVRQLQSVLKYAMIRTRGEVLTADFLPEDFRPLTRDAPRSSMGQASAACHDLAAYTLDLLRAGETDVYRRVSAEMDRIVLNAVLRHVKGNQVHASELLGISRTTLRAKLRALGLALEKQDFQDPANGD
jgi:two-component system nitrogen regulation response regulator GlnG